MCLFCDIKEGNVPSLKIDTDFYCFVLMDKFPVSPGHFLIVSDQHGEFLSDIDAHIRANMVDLAEKINSFLKDKNKNVVGFNILINDGGYAGQHIPHFHIHMVPRYRYDRFFLLLRCITSRFNPCNYLIESRAKTSFYDQIKAGFSSENNDRVTEYN